MANYIEILGTFYPNVSAFCSGDPTVYGNLIWQGGDPLPSKADMDVDWKSIMQETMWTRIKAERDRRKASGVKVGDYWFHSDDASRIQQIGLVMMGSNMPQNLMWKTLTGSFVTMTPTLATQVFQMVAYYDQNNFAKAEQHRQAMMALDDPTTYDYSGGWQLAYTDIGGVMP